MKRSDNYKVYEHITPSGKRYIGITKQTPEKRWQKGYGYIDSPYFSKAISKYGWDGIQHNIIASGLSADQAAQMEIELIKKHKSNNRKYGYNIADGGQVVHNAAKRKGAMNHKSEAVNRINLETGETIRFESMNQAADLLGISRQGIGKAVRGSCGAVTYMGYLWEYADKEFPKPKRKPKGRPPETCHKAVYLLDESGNVLKEYKSLQEAAQDNNCSYVGISKCCTGRLKTYLGRRWSYATE